MNTPLKILKKTQEGSCFGKYSPTYFQLLLLIICVCVGMFIYMCLSSVCCVSPYNLSYRVKEQVRTGKIRYKHAQRHLPHCIIIGVRKGGTRALLEFLNLHPKVQAHKSEIHFFDNHNNFENGLEWYRKKMPFSFKDQITIEKTPAYFTDDAAAGRIFQMNHSVKLLLVLRDPVDRTISDYTQISYNKQSKSLQFQKFETLALDMYGRVNKSYRAIQRSMYYKHMERWLHFFPLSSFHFVDGEKLVSDPSTELKAVETFLGLPHVLSRENFFFNKTRGFFCMKYDHKEKCLAKSKGRPHPYVRIDVIIRLKDFFRPLNNKFYNIIERNFHWT